MKVSRSTTPRVWLLYMDCFHQAAKSDWDADEGNWAWRNRQAGQDGTHLAKLPPPPAAGEAICLLRAAPPNPLEQLRAGAGCALLRNAFCRARGPPGRGKRSTLFLLAICFFLLLLFVVAHQAVYIGLDGQQLFHIVTRFAVVGICRFFLCQQRGIFGL